MKILAIGDTHFTPSNLEESEHFLLQVQQWLTTTPVDYIVILGDVLHSHEKIFTFALQMAIRFIKMCASFAPTMVMIGNHDASSNTIYCGNNHWMVALEPLSNVQVAEKPIWLTEGVLCCPYVSDGRFIEMLQEFAPNYLVDAKLIFAHQLFDGAQMGSIIANQVEVWPPTHPQIISGHIHDRQRPQPNLYYAGSSQQLAFNERGDKSLALVYVENNTVRWEEVYLSLKQRKVIHTSVVDVLKEVQKIREKPHVTFKVIIKDTDAAIKSFKKTVKYKDLESMSNVASVQFKVKEENVEMTPVDEETKIDFLSLLTDRVMKEADPYLQSYCQSLLTNGSLDQSDKDVQL